MMSTEPYLEKLMKRFASILTGLSVVVLFFMASAHAQYSEERATANIAFEFTVGDLAFPAGQYDFIRTASGVYTIRDAYGHGLLVTTAAPIQLAGAPKRSMLTFAVVDGRHVLVQIWNGLASSGNEFRQANPAMEVARHSEVDQVFASRP
jgi:hypothetical protein